MKINDNYRIEIDKYNHTLEKFIEVEKTIKVDSESIKEKRMEWRQLGFYGSIKSCIIGAMKDDIKVSDDVKGVIERIDLFEKTIKRG